MYRLQYLNTDLYLAGYNFRNKSQLREKYPVFSKFDYKLYFNKQRALEIIKEFDEYPLMLR